MATADRTRPARPGRLSVVVTSPDGNRTATRGLGQWLRQAAPPRAHGEVTVALISDRRMRTLNRAFRGTDQPTDVLAFPADGGPFLGDIAIATGVARQQANRAGHSMATELRLLALHGLLHLMGYDHETDDGRMRRAEARLRRAAGLEEGLIERGHPTPSPQRPQRREERRERSSPRRPRRAKR